MTQIRFSILGIMALGLLSFTANEKKLYTFEYPKKQCTTMIMQSSCDFGEFQKEWRDKDYYYAAISKDSIMCSVLYYKLNKDEQKSMTKPFGDIVSAGIPLIYFSENSNLKKYEKNNKNWGDMNGDFMYRQYDIIEVEGVKISQKHMYAYCMIDKEMFAYMHLSKINCSNQDSTAMIEIITSLEKKK